MDKLHEGDLQGCSTDEGLLNQELLVISSNQDTTRTHDAEALMNGRLDQVLGGNEAKTLLNVPDIEQKLKDSKLSAIVERLVQDYLDGSSHGLRIHRQSILFQIGVACLQLFIQNNWTGPNIAFNLLQCMTPGGAGHDKQMLQDVHDSALTELSLADCHIYPLVAAPEFLLLAKCILVDFLEETSNCLTNAWWAVRCLWIWQQVLDERAPPIFDRIIPLIHKVSTNNVFMCKESHPDLCMTFHLECCHILQYYYDYKSSREHLQSAEKLAGLKVSLTGALGKRTKFQHNNLAQLLLKVERESAESESAESELTESEPGTTHQKVVEQPKEPIQGLPKDLALDDDTLLNAIKLEDPGEAHIPSLSAVEQAIILALGVERKRNSPKQSLLIEEILAYVTTVLDKPQTWCVHMVALMLRCQLEKEKRRTVERAMMQMQSLVDQWRDDACPVIDRFKLFYATNLPPKWQMEKLLASLFMSLGSVSAALEVYIRLHLWEDVVDCYRRLGKAEKAERLIREQLALKETPLMLCLLGEVTQDAQFYQQAWEVSGQRSARAMKSLGRLYVDSKEYDKAIECLEKSIEKNYLQYNAWFLLGYAAIQAKKYAIAAKAYRRCVTLEPDNAEAWNNLSSAFINLKDKQKAFRTLQEALKCNYENWKIWENFMWTCIDIGEFGEAIKAYNRLMELREKYTDEEVLGILVKAVGSEDYENITDVHGTPASDFKKKLAELFGHLTSQVTNNAQIWSLYACLHGNGGSPDPEANDKALQCLQKAHRVKVQSPDWIKEVGSCKAVMEQSLHLAQVYTHCSSNKTNVGEAIQLLSSAKLMLKSMYSKCKQQQQEMIVFTTTWSEVDEPLSRMENMLETVTQKISQLKGQS